MIKFIRENYWLLFAIAFTIKTIYLLFQGDFTAFSISGLFTIGCFQAHQLKVMFAINEDQYKAIRNINNRIDQIDESIG